MVTGWPSRQAMTPLTRTRLTPVASRAERRSWPGGYAARFDHADVRGQARGQPPARAQAVGIRGVRRQVPGDALVSDGCARRQVVLCQPGERPVSARVRVLAL